MYHAQRFTSGRKGGGLLSGRHRLPRNRTPHSGTCSLVGGAGTWRSPLTFCHGLEVHLATVAPIARNGACPHLEDIDRAGFEALHGDRVGGAFYGCGVVLTELLLGNREDGYREQEPATCCCSLGQALSRARLPSHACAE